MIKSKVEVIPVTVPPAIARMEMLSGIRSKDEAVRWGVKHGYTRVYFLAKRQRVYAEKDSRNIIRLLPDKDSWADMPTERQYDSYK